MEGGGFSYQPLKSCGKPVWGRKGLRSLDRETQRDAFNVFHLPARVTLSARNIRVSKSDLGSNPAT